VHCRTTNCDTKVSPKHALLGRIIRLLWLKIRSTGAEVAGAENIFSNRGWSVLYTGCLTTSFQESESWVC